MDGVENNNKFNDSSDDMYYSSVPNYISNSLMYTNNGRCLIIDIPWYSLFLPILFKTKLRYNTS